MLEKLEEGYLTSEDNFKALKVSKIYLSPSVTQLTQGQMPSSKSSLDCGSASQQRQRGKPGTFLGYSMIVRVEDQVTTTLLPLWFRVWVMLIFRSTDFKNRLHW